MFFESSLRELYFWDFKKKYYVCEPTKTTFNFFVFSNIDPIYKNLVPENVFNSVARMIYEKRKIIKIQEQSLTCKNYINFRDGYINCETLDFTPHSETLPCDIFFRSCKAAEWETRPKVPLDQTCYEKLVFEILGRERELYEIFMFYLGLSFCNRPFDTFQMFIHLIGDPNNGKTFLYNRTSELYTSEEFTNLNFKELQKPESFLTANLDGKSLLFSEEQEASVFGTLVGFLKMYTGGAETMNVNKKGVQQYISLITAKVILSSNSLPRLGSVDQALLRRFFPMETHAVDENNTAYIPISKVAETYHKEVATVIEHCLYYYNLHRLKSTKKDLPFTCSKIIDLRNKIALKSNSVKEWLLDNFEMSNDKTDKIPLKVLHELYISAKTTINTRYAKEFNSFREAIEELLKEERLKGNVFLAIKKTSCDVIYSVRDGVVYIKKPETILPFNATERDPDYIRIETTSNRNVLCGFKMKDNEEIETDEIQEVPF